MKKGEGDAEGARMTKRMASIIELEGCSVESLCCRLAWVKREGGTKGKPNRFRRINYLKEKARRTGGPSVFLPIRARQAKGRE